MTKHQRQTLKDVREAVADVRWAHIYGGWRQRDGFLACLERCLNRMDPRIFHS